MAAPDDGQYSIPNPFSNDDPKPSTGNRFTKLVSSKTRVKPQKGGKDGDDSDSDQFDDPTELGGDANGKPPLPRRRTGWSSSMRQLGVATRGNEAGGGALGTLRSGGGGGNAGAAGGAGAGPRRKKPIPPMLGKIGRAKSERILSMRQKRNLQIRPGLLKDARGIALGRIENDGTWIGRNNARQGVFKQDGTIESQDGQQLGRIDPQTGSVLDARRTPIGEILPDGSVRDNNENVGHVTADGVAFNLSGQKLGSCDAGVRASARGPVCMCACVQAAI